MSSQTTVTAAAAGPFARVGRGVLAGVAYLGGLVVLFGDSAAALWREGLVARPVRAGVARELSWVFGMGFPLAGLVHVGMGSFLSMQAYFGGTFVDGAGAVVGVGLIRNVAPMMASLTLAGLLAARVVPGLRLQLARERAEAAEGRERPGFLARSGEGRRYDSRGPARPTVARRVPALLVASAVAGPVLATWGALVGTAVGWQVGRTILGVTTHSFFLMFWDLLWFLDVLGLLVKGTAFGLVAGLFACHEGTRAAADPDDADPAASLATPACRAACFSALAIMVINSGWFLLLYHAQTAFGPTLLPPPSR